MPAQAQLKSLMKKLGWVERIFILLAVVYVLLLVLAPGGGWFTLVQVVAFVFSIIVCVRLLRVVARQAIWRLRNRLIVTYLFIGGVPMLLLAVLVGLSGYLLASQVSVFLVSSELDRRVDALHAAAESVVRTDPPSRVETMRRMSDLFYRGRFPGIVMILRTPAGVTRYPADSDVEPPPASAPARSGVVTKAGEFFAWSHLPFNGGDITVLAPMGAGELSQLVPNLGIAELLFTSPQVNTAPVRIEQPVRHPRAPAASIPPPAFRFDAEVRFAAKIPAFDYGDPAEPKPQVLLRVESRLSAVYNVLFSRQSDDLQDIIPISIIIVSLAFLIVEMVSLVSGISMTRTITGTVHHLYEGTQHVIQGNFSHRVEVKGRDQLSDLGHSFNLMTERIESLLAVAKEKERLQSEIEIAREVQGQLYPKKVPDVRTMRLTAVCKPARMVSGDYFDYECIRESKLALAIGDVAGKGISAALLMATLQSSLRTELRNSTELAIAVGNGASLQPISTSKLVRHLNEQLHAYTSPEKYATFYLGIYDEQTSTLRYTNAGHLPPILIRNGEAIRLNVDGTVVGAFPFAQYDESEIALERGDLLVCFTDGVSEPENEFGEMFGEDRLVELCIRNAHRPEGEIVETIIAAVEEWTGSPELQDDLTLLLARRE